MLRMSMTSLRGILQLTNGGWIVDDRAGRSLVYRREMGSATMRVQYLLTDDGYRLRRSVEIVSDRVLTGESALSIISEITQQLGKAGISFQVDELTNFYQEGASQ